jgi:hypothetical protein
VRKFGHLRSFQPMRIIFFVIECRLGTVHTLIVINSTSFSSVPVNGIHFVVYVKTFANDSNTIYPIMLTVIDFLITFPINEFDIFSNSWTQNASEIFQFRCISLLCVFITVDRVRRTQRRQYKRRH